MKLKHFLKYMDPLTDVIIWYKENLDLYEKKEDIEPDYFGTIMDIPYWLTELYIVKPDKDFDGMWVTPKAGDSEETLKKYGDKPYLIITVEEKENK